MVACEVEIEAIEEEIKYQRTKIVQGKMSDPEIDTLQSLYRKAIVDHPGDLAGMTTACWAVYYHYISTDEDPQHDFCPDDEDSWCKYQQALATGQDPPSTHTLIPAGYQEAVKKVFKDLCHESLLSRCMLGATQNRNESFKELQYLSIYSATINSINNSATMIPLPLVFGNIAGFSCSPHIQVCPSLQLNMDSS